MPNRTIRDFLRERGVAAAIAADAVIAHVPYDVREDGVSGYEIHIIRTFAEAQQLLDAIRCR